jgi:hypothetical protein
VYIIAAMEHRIFALCQHSERTGQPQHAAAIARQQRGGRHHGTTASTPLSSPPRDDGQRAAIVATTGRQLARCYRRPRAAQRRIVPQAVHGAATVRFDDPSKKSKATHY